MDYTGKGYQLCGYYYKKHNGTYVHVDRHTHWRDELAPPKQAEYKMGKHEIKYKTPERKYGGA